MKSFIITLLLVIMQNDWQEYTNENFKFSTKYPSDWNKKNLENGIAFLSPKESALDPFQENVNVIIQEIGEMTSEEYFIKTKKIVIKNYGSSSVISSKPTVLAGMPSQEFIFKMKIRELDLKVKQSWVIISKKAYLVTYTSESDKFEKYLKTADQIVGSFKLL
jgi:serine/threonine-protein kinase